MPRRSDTPKVRYAVVGAGNIAQVAVLPAFAHARENSELAAIVSDDAEKREVLGERYGVPTARYDDLEALIDRERIDAIYIALPNTLHRPYVERGARAGVDILCEKPMAMSSADCRAMMAACEEAGVRLMIAYRLHFEEANLRAIDRVRSGWLGEPRYFSAVFSQQVRAGDIRTEASRGGGALFDMGVYCVNAARYLFGAEPYEVFGFDATDATDKHSRFRGVDEMTTGVMRFPGGRLAQFTCSQGAADVDSLRITGTDGDLRMEPAFGYSGALKHYVTVGGKTTEQAFGKRDQFAPELVSFSAAIVEGRPPLPDGREGLADVRVMEALRRSAQTGERVSLEPFDPGPRPRLADAIQKPAVTPPKPVNAPSPNR
jgi:predicted dehydrogenase